MSTLVNAVLSEYGQQTEAALETYFPNEPCFHNAIFQACRYSLLGGGKRLRPALLLDFFRLCGGETAQAMPFACGLEMIHTYSLIHDDLPCMDDDDYRRGRPSCHKAYGVGLATLAGDGLLNRAFEVMLSQQAIAPQRAMEAAAYIAGCSGVYGMVGGQVQDLALEQQGDESRLQEMVSLKTGALIRAACLGGCILAGADESKRHAALIYANSVGLAFQIQDDILDVTGQAEKLGKSVGSDAVNGKCTFVSVYGLDECRHRVAQLTSTAVDAAKTFADSAFLQELAVYLSKRDH